jgi:hypothetical protein
MAGEKNEQRFTKRVCKKHGETWHFKNKKCVQCTNRKAKKKIAKLPDKICEECGINHKNHHYQNGRLCFFCYRQTLIMVYSKEFRQREALRVKALLTITPYENVNTPQF